MATTMKSIETPFISSDRPAHRSSTYDSVLERIGVSILRYGLVAILLYFGAFKFHPAEAAGIEPLVANNALMSWLLPILGVRGTSNLVGVTEITIAVLIALRSFWPKVSALGSMVAIGMFLITLTFLFYDTWHVGSHSWFPLATSECERRLSDQGCVFAGCRRIDGRRSTRGSSRDLACAT